MKQAEEIVKGRKTFFIAPDDSLISQSFMEEYLSKDYECYFVNNDLKTSLESKIQTIVSIFSDCILFINIDCHVDNIDWPVFISQMMMAYPGVCIGVLYAKRKNAAQKAEVEHLYLYEIGISGGCIQLEYQKNNNFMLIEKVLYLNQAQGRRKTVRAVCMNNCFVNYMDKRGKNITRLLNDISVSHFSITVPMNENFDVQEYERLNNLSFVIKGLRFVSDAILYMKRPTDDGNLYVFAFVNESGKIGLDSIKKQHMIQKMYEIINETCNSLLLEKYQETEMQLREKRNNAESEETKEE